MTFIATKIAPDISSDIIIAPEYAQKAPNI